MLSQAVRHLKVMTQNGDDADDVAYVGQRLFDQVSAADPGWTFVHFDSPDGSHVFCGATALPVVVRPTHPAELWRVPPPGLWPVRSGAAPCPGVFMTDDPNYGDPNARQI